MRCIFFYTLVVAVPLLSHGYSTCQDLQKEGNPLDIPPQGMRWTDSSKCLTCDGPECDGCRAADSTCARCVYDIVTCEQSRPDSSMCKDLVKGQELRKQDCGGSSFPFYGPETYSLCKGDDIPELNSLPPMTTLAARNICAWYRSKSNASQFCIGFEWNNKDQVSVPLDDCPAGIRYDDGIMWRRAPKCQGCQTTDTCDGCRNGTFEPCEECVFDKEKCYNGPGKAVCDRLINGVRARHEPTCGEPEPTPKPNVWPEGLFKMTFKTAFRPDLGGHSCDQSGSGSASALRVSSQDGAPGSAKRKFMPVPYHAVQDPQTNPTNENMDDILNNQCSTASCQAWSYKTVAFPPLGIVNAEISNTQDLVYDPNSFAMVMLPAPPSGESKGEAKSMFVV